MSPLATLLHKTIASARALTSFERLGLERFKNSDRRFRSAAHLAKMVLQAYQRELGFGVIQVILPTGRECSDGHSVPNVPVWCPTEPASVPTASQKCDLIADTTIVNLLHFATLKPVANDPFLKDLGL